MFKKIVSILTLVMLMSSQTFAAQGHAWAKAATDDQEMANVFAAFKQNGDTKGAVNNGSVRVEGMCRALHPHFGQGMDLSRYCELFRWQNVVRDEWVSVVRFREKGVYDPEKGRLGWIVPDAGTLRAYQQDQSRSSHAPATTSAPVAKPVVATADAKPVASAPVVDVTDLKKVVSDLQAKVRYQSTLGVQVSGLAAKLSAIETTGTATKKELSKLSVAVDSVKQLLDTQQGSIAANTQAIAEWQQKLETFQSNLNQALIERFGDWDKDALDQLNGTANLAMTTAQDADARARGVEEQFESLKSDLSAQNLLLKALAVIVAFFGARLIYVGWRERATRKIAQDVMELEKKSTKHLEEQMRMATEAQQVLQEQTNGLSEKLDSVADQVGHQDIQFSAGDLEVLENLQDGFSCNVTVVVDGVDMFTLPFLRKGRQFFTLVTKGHLGDHDPKVAVSPLKFVRKNYPKGMFDAWIKLQQSKLHVVNQ